MSKHSSNWMSARRLAAGLFAAGLVCLILDLLGYRLLTLPVAALLALAGGLVGGVASLGQAPAETRAGDLADAPSISPADDAPALQSLPESVLAAFDADRRCIHASARLARLLGCPMPLLLGRRIDEIFGPEHIVAFGPRVTEVLSGVAQRMLHSLRPAGEPECLLQIDSRTTVTPSATAPSGTTASGPAHRPRAIGPGRHRPS